MKPLLDAKILQQRSDGEQRYNYKYLNLIPIKVKYSMKTPSNVTKEPQWLLLQF